MIGRAAQLHQVRGLLDQARSGHSAALFVDGEAGVGKTTLLAAAAAAAEGFLVLRTRGVESEAGVDHAGLLELVAPLRERVADLPPRPAGAVAAALGWGGDEVAGDRYLVGAGTLMLLAAAAERQPVLVVVDDLQWLDRESAQAVLFAARRLSADAVAVLLAARAGTPLPVEVDGVERLPLDGLAGADAQTLLDGLSAPVADRLREATGGNPLAMLETAARLSAAQRLGAAPLPQPLPVGERLERDYGRLLAGLTPGAWRAVLLLAASHDEAEAPVVDALRAAGLDAEAALDEAQSRGVFTGAAGRLAFRHPLLRSAAWRVATAAQRRDAHRALAAVLPAGSADRALHVAAATAGRNEELARELAALGGTMRARRGLAAASEALERAAGLTSDPALASGWLAEAVDDAFLAGDSDRARELGRRALAHGEHPGVLHTLGLVEEFGGEMARAADLQERSAEVGTGPLRVRALAALVHVRYRLGDPAGMTAAARRLEAVADPTDPEQRMLAAYSVGAAHTFAGDFAAGRELILQARDQMEAEPSLRDDPRHLLPAILVAMWLGDASLALPYADRRLDAARERGALGVLAPALALVAFGWMQLGDHARAYAYAGEAVELAAGAGYLSDLAAAHLALAVGDASRGRHDAAARECAEAHRLVDRAGLGEVAEFVVYYEAFCAACRDDPQGVVALLEPRLATPAPGDRMELAPELVEAYLAVGRADEAGALAHRYAAANPPPLAPSAAAVVARTRALVEPDLDAASGLFDEACAAFGTDVFEVARTRLAHGARLRRAGRRTAAREQLRAARDTFAAADLTAWAQKAAAELAATGETARPRRLLPDEPLTSQETRVALLVARGMTNKEVAAALFLSPKTVEHHLGSVYRKRGLRSRTELARAFPTDTGP